MKSWQLRLGLFLVFLSALTYFIHFLVFEDLHHILIYLVGDVAFVFIEVLLVTLIIHELLDRREKEALIGKMSTVVGAFFSELGRPMIVMILKHETEQRSWVTDLRITKDWTANDYRKAVNEISEKGSSLKLDAKAIAEIKQLLIEKRRFLLGMMENPNLLEHEKFTELLLALFHVQEELLFRGDIEKLPRPDISHLNKDINRAYGLIIREWIMHMKHLQDHYPYLFSLAARTNPFDPEADSIVKE